MEYHAESRKKKFLSGCTFSIGFPMDRQKQLRQKQLSKALRTARIGRIGHPKCTVACKFLSLYNHLSSSSAVFPLRDI